MLETVGTLIDTIEAVLFDMDGVIIDGMPFHAKAWQLAFEEIGLSITEREVYEREGESGLSAVTLFLNQRGLTPSPAEVQALINRKETIFKSIVNAKPFKGVVELLRDLKAKGKRLGLVTGTARHELDQSLPKELFEMFETSITGDEVMFGKPNPEPYQNALVKMGLCADQVVVIENAPLGIESAKQAGCICLAVETSLPKSYLQKADYCFKSIIELGVFLFTK